MNRTEEYHWRGLDPVHLSGLVLLAGFWALLFALAPRLPDWQMVIMIGAVAISTAAYWRYLTRMKRSGAWMTETHLNVYYGNKHWSFPLSGIQAVGRGTVPYLGRAPHLELTSGRQVDLPQSCLPAVPELRRWFADKPIRINAKADPTATIGPLKLNSE